jgi:hypothetical protein
MVGGPGFEPGASRSRTVAGTCPQVSDRLPCRPREYEIDLGPRPGTIDRQDGASDHELETGVEVEGDLSTPRRDGTIRAC